MKHSRILLPFAAALLVSACGLEPEACSLEAIAGLNVSVVDDSTGRALCAATVTATEGSYSETLETFTSTAPCAHIGAFERAGTYDVAVAANGYVAETVRDVEVEDGGCHVKPATFEVRLSPSP